MALAVFMLAGCARSPAAHLETRGSFCRSQEAWVPRATWQEISPGDHLRVPGVLMTCDASGVRLSALSRMSSDFAWEERGNRFHAELGPRELVTLHSLSTDQPSPAQQVEVLWTTGRVQYSTDMPAKYARVQAGGPGSSLAKALAATRERLAADLKVLDWEPLTETRVLDEWDMIWTGDNGRLEIEMLPESKQRPDRTRSDSDMIVIDEHGHLSAKRRFLPRTYFIVQPEWYGPAKVNRILGTVYVARDRDQVKQFFAKWRSTMQVVAELDKAGYERQKAFLRSPTLQ